MIVVWAILMRFARRWAVLGALLAAAVVIALDPRDGAGTTRLLPALTFTMPAFDAGALVSLALPLFVVTMASQNIPGIGVLASFGYRPPLRPSLVSTGAASVVGAPFGAHGINLAAITAAMAAGPDAHPDPARRWIASASGGVDLPRARPDRRRGDDARRRRAAAADRGRGGPRAVRRARRRAAAAAADAERREAAVVTFVVSASSITVAGISSPFWGLVAGLVFLGVQRARRRAPPAASASRARAPPTARVARRDRGVLSMEPARARTSCGP